MSFTPLGAKFLYDADDDTGPAVWRNAALTGATDSFVGSLSISFKLQQPVEDPADGWQVYNAGGVDFILSFTDSGGGNIVANVVFQLVAPGGSDWVIVVDCPGVDDGECHHLQVAWNSNFTSGNKLVTAALDGSPATVSTNDDGGQNALEVDIESMTSLSIGMFSEFQTNATISLAEFYWQNGSYLDLSNQTNIDKFWAADTGFADLGTTGATPTGSQPLIYLSVRSGGVADDFMTNRGSGGDFVNGGTGSGGDPLILVDPFCPTVAQETGGRVIAVMM